MQLLCDTCASKWYTNDLLKEDTEEDIFLHSLVVHVINNSVLQLLNFPSLSTREYLKLTSLYTIVVLRRTLQASFYMASCDCKPLVVKGSQSWQAYSKWGQMHVQWIVSKVLVSAQL